MLGRTSKCFAAALLLVTLSVILGCGGGGGKANLVAPVADITGTWEGEARDPNVSGNYFFPIEFTFRQNTNTVTGVSSFPGLARFRGTIDGNVLAIEGTDIYAYISSDGSEIRGTYTASGTTVTTTTGGTATAATSPGQTATFYLNRVTTGGIKF